MDAREAHVALNLIEGVGPIRVRQLLEHFGGAPAILAASRSQLLQVRGIGDDTATAIAGWEKSLDLPGESKRIGDFGCRVVIQSDEEYPASLREIYDPPIVLYAKGTLTDAPNGLHIGAISHGKFTPLRFPKGVTLTSGNPSLIAW